MHDDRGSSGGIFRPSEGSVLQLGGIAAGLAMLAKVRLRAPYFASVKALARRLISKAFSDYHP